MPENPTSFGNLMSPSGAGARNRGGGASSAPASASFATRGSAPKPAAVKRSDSRAGWRGFCCNRAPRDTREPPPARLLRSPPLDGVSLASVVMQLMPRPDEVAKKTPIESCLFQSKVVAPLRRAGLRVRLWRGITDGLTVPPLYLQTWAPAARLLTEAARLGKQLPLCGAAVAAADVAANARALEASGVSVRGVPASELEIPPAPAEEGGAALAAQCTAGKPIDAYVRLSAPYSEEPALQPLFAKQTSTGGLLTEAQAVQMLLSVIAADPDECGGAGLSLAELALPVTLFAPGIDKKACLLQKWYVVHTDEGRARLAAEWHALAPPWNPPVAALREYLGETVAFFFAFFGFISKWLLAPAVLGTAVFGNQVATGNYATVHLPAYGMLVSIWASLLLVFWGREEKRLAQAWGVVGFTSQEALRPEFVARSKKVRSPIDGTPTFYFSPLSKATRRVASTAVTTTCIGIVIILATTVVLLRGTLQNAAVAAVIAQNASKFNATQLSLYNSSLLASVPVLPVAAVVPVSSTVNSVQIQVMNQVYQGLARFLTLLENPPTQSMHDASLIVKLVTFQLANSFFALVYIAFFKKDLTIAGPPQPCMFNPRTGITDCLFEVSYSLSMLILINLVMAFVMGIIYPPVMRGLFRGIASAKGAFKAAAQRKRTLDAQRALAASPFEFKPGAVPYVPMMSYLSTAVLFGYATLFAVALPSAPVAVFGVFLFNNAIWRRFILDNMRALPAGSEGIGPWEPIFAGLTLASTITNIALVTFTNGGVIFGIDMDFTTRLIFFIALEHAMLLVRAGVVFLIPDMGPHTETQLARQAYLVAKLFKGVKDKKGARRLSVAAPSGRSVAANAAGACDEPITPAKSFDALVANPGGDGGDVDGAPGAGADERLKNAATLSWRLPANVERAPAVVDDVDDDGGGGGGGGGGASKDGDDGADGNGDPDTSRANDDDAEDADVDEV